MCVLYLLNTIENGWPLFPAHIIAWNKVCPHWRTRCLKTEVLVKMAWIIIAIYVVSCIQQASVLYGGQTAVTYRVLGISYVWPSLSWLRSFCALIISMFQLIIN